ncbi:hypothetical protein Ssi02_22650 [Sinosporangium siamense]|uniref:Uncharacterized protein n=1 Tax=Sinosporangium siamense TaxID=1367973 RepID=A0A919RHP2_9ACTN|nr:hypothetical protein Ssi02_22650 [Sinosporangium siamense]
MGGALMWAHVVHTPRASRRAGRRTWTWLTPYTGAGRRPSCTPPAWKVPDVGLVTLVYRSCAGSAPGVFKGLEGVSR